MKHYRFTLDPGSKKYFCPNCGRKRFVRYIDTVTGKLLPGQYGRCDREDSCRYHLKPGKQGFSKQLFRPSSKNSVAKIISSYVPPELLIKSLKQQAKNNFISYLGTLFPSSTVDELVQRYHIGSSDHWPGATIFWQIDLHGRIRAGKVMLYELLTGKRVKEPFNHVTWVHCIEKLNPFNLKQCLFGEHLLNQHPDKPIAITESEKTAVIASGIFPEFIWMATGQKNGLSIQKMLILARHRVILFPDLGVYEKWQAKAREIKLRIPTISIATNNLIEITATNGEIEKGLDLADYLIHQSDVTNTSK